MIRDRTDDTTETAYRDSLDWLYRQTRGSAPRDPARMNRLVEALDLTMPPRVVHVVGTNGKGTVTSMVAASFSSAGTRSGCFISPHVEDFRERIGVDGVPIAREEVIAFVERVRSANLQAPPAFFELSLALALEHFARHDVEMAAMEAGVGARHDATAVLANVAAVAITPIALDHVDTLGPTLVDVASDKSAAIRPGVPVASARQSTEVRTVLAAAARRQGVSLRIDEDADDLFEPPASAPLEVDPVRGRNARLAAAVTRLAGGVPEPALACGLAIAPLPGRGERFRVGEREVLLDGAHDPAAAAALVERAARPYILVFGALSRKQGEESLRRLETGADRVFVTSVAHEPVTLNVTPERTVVPEPRAALAAALAACPAGGLVVVAGSLYLAGELRPLLRELARSDRHS